MNPVEHLCSVSEGWAEVGSFLLPILLLWFMARSGHTEWILLFNVRPHSPGQQPGSWNRLEYEA